MNLKWIIVSQSWVLFGSGLVFPFYIVFIREVGGSFSQFGLAYGMFMLSSALAHRWVGSASDKFGRKIFLLMNAWGTAVLFLLFPMVMNIWEVYVLQVLLGILGAMQKTSEKALIADFTEGNVRGKQIGSYHFWISIFSGLAVIVGGFLIDIFTVDLIFYIGSVVLFVSGVFVMRIKEINGVAKG